MMKNILNVGKFLLFSLCLLILESCSAEEEIVEPQITIPENVLSKGVLFSRNGGMQTISIQSNVNVEVSSDQSWCTASAGSMTAALKIIPIEVTVLENSEGQIRTSILSIVGDGVEKQITITQFGGKIVDMSVVELPAEGGNFNIQLAVSQSVSSVINDTWIKEATVETKGLIEQTLTFAASTNHGGEREGSITFIMDDVQENVIIKQAAGTPNPMQGENGWEVAKSLGLGWNLGNQLESVSNGVSNETAWGNQPTTQAMFDKLAAAGFTSVRIPVTWSGHIGEAPDYLLEETWLNRVAEVVEYAECAGLKALINIHHDGWLNIKEAAQDENKNQLIKNELRAVWTQIAKRFKDKGSFLMFESMNEIHDGGWGWGGNRTDGGHQYAILNNWNQVFVDAVRAVGGENLNRYLGVPGYVTNIGLTLQSFVLPKDVVSNRLMLAVHCYDPMEYTLDGKYSEWGHTGDPSKKANYGDEESLVDQFKQLKEKFVDNGIPVYIGEMGCDHRKDSREEAFRRYYLEYFCKAAKTYGIAPFYWDDGGADLCLLNHATGELQKDAEEAIAAMTRAIFNEDASYTLQTVYDNAPQ